MHTENTPAVEELEIEQTETVVAETLQQSKEENISDSLTLMWQGMLGIFVVMVAISLIVAISTKFKKKPKDQQ